MTWENYAYRLDLIYMGLTLAGLIFTGVGLLFVKLSWTAYTIVIRFFLFTAFLSVLMLWLLSTFWPA